MDNARLTDGCRTIMEIAKSEARRWGHSYISTEHILLSLIRCTESFLFDAIRRSGLEIGETLVVIRNNIFQAMASSRLHPDMPTEQLPITNMAREVIEGAEREADILGHRYIGSVHILLSLTNRPSSVACKVLSDCGLPPSNLRYDILASLSAQAVRASKTVGGQADHAKLTETLADQDEVANLKSTLLKLALAADQCEAILRQNGFAHHEKCRQLRETIVEAMGAWAK